MGACSQSPRPRNHGEASSFIITSSYNFSFCVFLRYLRDLNIIREDSFNSCSKNFPRPAGISPGDGGEPWELGMRTTPCRPHWDRHCHRRQCCHQSRLAHPWNSWDSWSSLPRQCCHQSRCRCFHSAAHHPLPFQWKPC